jgi:hypothetical protein
VVAWFATAPVPAGDGDQGQGQTAHVRVASEGGQHEDECKAKGHQRAIKEL